MVPTFDLTDRKSGRSLAIAKNDAAQNQQILQKSPLRRPLHTNYLRRITAGGSGSSMISHIFRKIIRIPLTIACTTLDERQVLILEYTAWEHFKCLYRHLPDFFPPEPPVLLRGDVIWRQRVSGKNTRRRQTRTSAELRPSLCLGRTLRFPREHSQPSLRSVVAATPTALPELQLSVRRQKSTRLHRSGRLLRPIASTKHFVNNSALLMYFSPQCSRWAEPVV
jgi:hypothetical protein